MFNFYFFSNNLRGYKLLLPLYFLKQNKIFCLLLNGYCKFGIFMNGALDKKC